MFNLGLWLNGRLFVTDTGGVIAANKDGRVCTGFYKRMDGRGHGLLCDLDGVPRVAVLYTAREGAVLASILGCTLGGHSLDLAGGLSPKDEAWLGVRGAANGRDTAYAAAKYLNKIRVPFWARLFYSVQTAAKTYKSATAKNDQITIK